MRKLSSTHWADFTSSRRVLYTLDYSGEVEGVGLNAKKTKVMHIQRHMFGVDAD